MVFDRLIREKQVNAAIGWTLIGTMALGAAESFLTNAILWGLFSLTVVAVAALPALADRDWTAMVPWLLVLVATIAVIVGAVGFYSEAAGYVVTVSLALIIVVELEVFTPVELSQWFAVSFAVMTTLAIQSLWIVAQFCSDLWLGTEFLSTQTELQRDIVIVTVVGLAVGGFFYWYFTRFEPAGAVNRSSSHAGPS